ncbi:MAG: hypothetical protein JNM57_13355 [Cyclobacteriaceae bacterium]|nr:hypothetical protein [Cyclobacteriaceae bacterium]
MPQQDHFIQQKIEALIYQLEEEVKRLSSNHASEINKLKEANEMGMQKLMNEFDQRLRTMDEHHHTTIVCLEDEINYLKELNSSQRLMMEDSLGYIKELEQKLNSTRSIC